MGPCLLTIHHLGSTSVPVIYSTPILDLIPVAKRLSDLDARRAKFEALGYEWWGEYGHRPAAATLSASRQPFEDGRC